MELHGNDIVYCIVTITPSVPIYTILFDWIWSLEKKKILLKIYGIK